MKLKKQNLFALASLFVLSATFLTSCKKKQEVDPGTAKLRVVNTMSNNAAQYFYQEDVNLTPKPINYGEFSDYANVVAGYGIFWSQDELSKKTAAKADVVLRDKAKYTLFLYESATDIKPMITGLEDTDKAPAAGKFRVRFVNVCAAFNGRSLVIADQSGLGVSSGLKFGDIPVYLELAVNTALKINVKDETVVTTIPVGSFVEGKTYLVWFDTLDGMFVDYHIVTE